MFEAEKLIAFAEKHRRDWGSGMTPQLANAIGKINDARKRQAEKDRRQRHLASCVFVNGVWLCAADCRHHVIVDAEA